MKKFASLLLQICLSFSLLAADIDIDIERANKLIETDPAHAVLLCDSLKIRNPNLKQQGILAHTLGNAYFAQGETEAAISEFGNSAKLAWEAKDSLTWASALSDMGVCYRISGDTKQALTLYNQALTILSQLDAPSEKSYLLTSIAVLYANNGLLPESIKYARQAFDSAKKSGDIEAIMYAGQTLGIVLSLNGDNAEGLAIEREMVAIAEKHRLPRYILKTYASIIDMHHKEGRKDSVDYYIKKGKEILPQVPEGSVEALGFLEESYVVLTEDKRYKESLDIQNKILSMKGAGTYMPFDKLYQRMARNYKGLGEIDKMEEAYERSIAISDSLHGADIDRQLSEFDVKYDTATRELKISRLEADKNRQTLWIVIISGLAFFIIGGIIAFMIVRHNKIKRDLQIKAMRDQLNAIDNERARVAAELHDGICSDLTGIGLLLQSKSADKTEITSLIENVRTDIRTISHTLMPPRMEGLTLRQLLDSYASGSNGVVAINGNGDVTDNPEAAFQIYRIVQEWVQNILRHSTADTIEIKLDSDMLEITDNGEEYTSDSSTGIGLQTIHKRAASIKAEIMFERKNEKNILKITVK